MVQVPTATSVTIAPDTVQKDGVVEAKLTARPEEAVAPTVNGAVPKGWLESAPKVMVWLPDVTWKLRFTAVAAAQLVLPDCVAWMVQVPTATSVTVAPDTVQKDGVVEAKLTVSPELAVAPILNGVVPNGWFKSVAKVMVWLPAFTWKPWFTGVAAAQLELPVCVAWMVQVPTATSVTVAPDSVQKEGVVEAKPTASPEDAVAPTLNGAVPKGWFESVAKLMVWLPAVTWKLWFTGVAAAQLELPVCAAWMVQLPTATSVTVAPDSVQKEGVVEAKLTARPEEALAPTGNGVVPKGWLASAPKLMVWLPGVTWKLWSTGVAGS